ncbi:unnamed protein product [Caenorhabditis angaria]|uniref:Uncharacterized protein n=1 Tax=Caenorhabditis angaria TaxID=860376 RepID=A0A9P1IA89_9PELO|nr:unnamed protein product [Caenorhabditis angaria]
MNILEEEDENELSPLELKCRKLLGLSFRIFLAVFTVVHLFDFLFSSVWMHGYIWSLNLPIDLDMNDKAAGAIVRHQLDEMGNNERIIQSILVVFGVLMALLANGFSSNKSTWHLFRLSSIIGVVCALVRPVQMKQRFFSSLHEGFYCYFMFFIVSFILTFRFGEKLKA